VDLEGAKTGQTTNLPTITALAKETNSFIQVGGGIRSMETIEAYIKAGANRVILGTAAIQNPDFAAEAVAKYGDKIAVGVDLKDGKLAIHGWTETAAMPFESFSERMQEIGVSTMICTDISKDGAMMGTNRALYRELVKNYSMQVIASGGVSSLDDIKALKESGVYGAIIGKAYYTGAIDLAEAVKLGGEGAL
jgi:phosphoribosylformimino-5-aminoimidazole carboxamide ribotide isomerase